MDGHGTAVHQRCTGCGEVIDGTSIMVGGAVYCVSCQPVLNQDRLYALEKRVTDLERRLRASSTDLDDTEEYELPCNIQTGTLMKNNGCTGSEFGVG